MRITFLLVFVLTLSPHARAEQEAATVSYMYDLCKQYEQMNDGEDQSVVDKVKAMNCVAYMAGAFQAYGFAMARASTGTRPCDLSQRTPDHLVRTFLQHVRSQPTSSRTTPTQIAVGMIMENCFCHRDPDLAAAMCPLLPVE